MYIINNKFTKVFISLLNLKIDKILIKYIFHK